MAAGAASLYVTFRMLVIMVRLIKFGHTELQFSIHPLNFRHGEYVPIIFALVTNHLSVTKIITLHQLQEKIVLF